MSARLLFLVPLAPNEEVFVQRNEDGDADTDHRDGELGSRPYYQGDGILSIVDPFDRFDFGRADDAAHAGTGRDNRLSVLEHICSLQRE